MIEEFDIIDYPLKLNTSENLIFMKLKYKYELRILNTLDSKKIYASKLRNIDLFLFLEINGNTVNIIGVTYNLYMFEGPLDFYVDNTSGIETYRYFTNNLLNESVNATLDLSTLINKPFPEFTLPIINFYEKASKILKYRKSETIHKK